MNRIKELRREQSWTQTDLANRISTAKSTVCRYELETSALDPKIIRKLCDIFNVTADYLLGFSNQRSSELTAEEYALLDAFRAAEPHIQSSIKMLLQPYWEERTAMEAGSSLSVAE